MEKEGWTSSPFMKMARRYPKPLDIVFDSGLTRGKYLNEKKEFRTTPRHTLVVATICDTLGGLIKLPADKQEVLNVTAILHDADKRLELRPDEFTPEQKSELIQQIGSHADHDLLLVTKEAFVNQNKDNVGNIPLSEMLLYYADMIVSWDKITPFRERIAESRTRRPDLPNEFFDTEIKFGSEVEERIFKMLPEEVRIKIETPDQIPNYLIDTLSEK